MKKQTTLSAASPRDPSPARRDSCTLVLLRIPVVEQEQERSGCRRALLGLLPHSILPLCQLPASQRQPLPRHHHQIRVAGPRPPPLRAIRRAATLRVAVSSSEIVPTLQPFVWSSRNLRTPRDTTPATAPFEKPELPAISPRASVSAPCTTFGRNVLRATRCRRRARERPREPVAEAAAPP